MLLDTERDHSSAMQFAGGFEFRIGGEGSGLATRGMLPKGTTRK